MTDTDIRSFLTEFAFPPPEGEDPTDLGKPLEDIGNGLFEFLKNLGYDTSDIFREVTLPVSRPAGNRPGLSGEFVADYIIGQSPAATPYIIAEASLGEPDEINYRQNSIRAKGALAEYPYYFPALNFGFFVIFTNQYLVIAAANGDIDVYYHSELTEEEVTEIRELLEPPKSFPSRPVPASAYHPNQTRLDDFEVPPFPDASGSATVIDEGPIKLDLTEYSDALWKANKADSANEKGTALENLAEVLFESITCLTVRDTRVQTRTSEIDLIVEHCGSGESTLFDYQGRFFLVECKNWVDPVPVDEVGDFESKLLRTGTDLGVLFAWSGISGEESDEHAQRLVDHRASKRPTILILDERDLYRIAQGKSFYEIIDEKLYRRRFDIHR